MLANRAEVIIVAEVALVFQRYVFPPDAVSVAFCPEQIGFVPLMEGVGREFTVTENAAAAVQLKLFVTVTL